MSFKEKLKILLQTKFVKKTCMVFSLIAMTSALALVAIACTPESVQDPSSSPITTPSDDSKPSEVTPGGETTDDAVTDPENPDITDPETPTEPEDPGITEPEDPGIAEPEDPDITEPTDPENPDITDPETPVDPEEPEIEDPTPEVSFEDVYNEVFGEGYDLVPFEQYFDKIPEMLFDFSREFKVLATEFNADNFVIYADCAGYADEELNNTFPGHSLARATYRGTTPAVLLDYEALTQEAGGLPLKAYLESKYSTSSMSAEEIRTELETYKTRTDAIDRMKRFFDAGCETYFDLIPLVTNTTDDIDFSAYAEEYTPEGATPLKCYVGSFKGYVYDDPLNPLFNTGYTIECPVVVMYSYDGSNELTIESFALRVPRHRDYTNEKMYSFGLGEINETYFKINVETTVIENPILSDELLANIENSL